MVDLSGCSEKEYIMTSQKLFSSESVSPGHPDKMADQISDAILDAILEQDAKSHVACEVLIKNNTVVIAGEIRTNAHVFMEELIKDVIKDIGYCGSSDGFDLDQCNVINMITEQSHDIAQGVDSQDKKKQGAGDQGLMFGYATDETKELMPMPHALANSLVKRQSELFRNGDLPWLRPDAKAQVAVIYEKEKIVAIHTVILSTQHTDDIGLEDLKKEVLETIIMPTLPEDLLRKDTQFFINPTGQFILGGPHADCGLTGRKIIVDTYGGVARHGGGCFSGKDPSKVDRSGAYAARYIAKHLVAAGLAKKCEVQVAYAIGLAEPTSIRVDTFGTANIQEQYIEKIVKDVFPLTPYDIISELDLLRPIYRQTATFGHFGRDELDLPWEKLDRLERLKSAAAHHLK